MFHTVGVCINADGRKHQAKVGYDYGCAKLYFQVNLDVFPKNNTWKLQKDTK